MRSACKGNMSMRSTKQIIAIRISQRWVIR